MAGLVAVSYSGQDASKLSAVHYLIHSVRVLQHRGKAYWKLIVGNRSAAGEGSLPANEQILRIASREKLVGTVGIGYLSKKSPPFASMQSIQVAFDGFFVDTEKLHLHPHVGAAKESDSLSKICNIFREIVPRNAERAAEFLDRHLRGNLVIKLEDGIYAYRDSTGFKPMCLATSRNGSLAIVASENSLRASLIDLVFDDLPAGQLLRIGGKEGTPAVLSAASGTRPLMDPFEFIRESSVIASIGGKSMYEIRKSIGREQAENLSKHLGIIDSVYAEPDYTRPMALGFGLRYKLNHSDFELAEGIIKDRYDDSDHMIDFSEEVSKNKLLTTGRSLKFVMQNITQGRSVVSVQGTIQTGSTTRETINYLKNADAARINVIVSYVPTVDGRQVGLYTQNRELIANKYVGEVNSINELNRHVAQELGCDAVCYNSPSILAKGIGIPENNLWFPEWVRFLDYK